MVTEKKQKKYKLSAALGRLVKKKMTGTLICVNEQNLQGRIFVKEGSVLMARCRNHEGKNALKIIQQYPLILLKFHQNKNLVSLEKDNRESTAPTEVKEASAPQESGTDQSSSPDALPTG